MRVGKIGGVGDMPMRDGVIRGDKQIGVGELGSDKPMR